MFIKRFSSKKSLRFCNEILGGIVHKHNTNEKLFKNVPNMSCLKAKRWILGVLWGFPLLPSVLFCIKKKKKSQEMASKIQIMKICILKNNKRKSGPSTDLKGDGES